MLYGRSSVLYSIEGLLVCAFEGEERRLRRKDNRRGRKERGSRKDSLVLLRRKGRKRGGGGGLYTAWGREWWRFFLVGCTIAVLDAIEFPFQANHN